MKKITLAMVCMLVLMAIGLSGCNTNKGQVANLQSKNSELDVFENVPIIEEGKNLLEMYISNTAQLTEEQFEFLAPKVTEKYSMKDSYCTLMRGKNGEAYIQYVSESETDLYTSTWSGRVRCFNTLDDGIILIGIDSDGRLKVTCFDKSTHPIYLRVWHSAHYRDDQVEGATKLYGSASTAMFFFPEEEKIRIFSLTNIEKEYSYPVLGKFIGRSDSWKSSWFITQDKDKVYVYSGSDSVEAIQEYLLAGGVESVEIINSSNFQVRMHMLNGTIKTCSYTDDFTTTATATAK